MFIRFRTYPHRNGQRTLEVSLQHSVWHKDKSQPRAQYLAYLGSIRVERLPMEAACRTFWERALAKLDTVELEKRQRTRLERALAARIPRPAKVVPLDAEEQRRRYWARQWAQSAKRAQRQHRA